MCKTLIHNWALIHAALVWPLSLYLTSTTTSDCCKESPRARGKFKPTPWPQASAATHTYKVVSNYWFLMSYHLQIAVSNWTHVEWLHCEHKWNLQPAWRDASWWLPLGKHVVVNPSPGIWLFCSWVFYDLGIKLSHDYFGWLNHAEAWAGHQVNENQSLKPHSSYYLPGWPY